jgi:hypothetical protein
MKPYIQQNTELIKSSSKAVKQNSRRRLSTELFKCAGQEFMIGFLRFLNNIWDGEPSESWLKAIIIQCIRKEISNSVKIIEK